MTDRQTDIEMKEQGGKNARREAGLKDLHSVPSSVKAETERSSSLQSKDGDIGFGKEARTQREERTQTFMNEGS